MPPDRAERLEFLSTLSRESVMMKSVVHLAAGLALFSLVTISTGASARAEESEEQEAVERTRRVVRMLDDIYKTAVVLITEHYVADENDFPAGTAAIALFDAIKQKGWHEVRLIDVSGAPSNPDNVAGDAFEREVVELFASGRADYKEEVVTRDGARFLRAATPIPVVMEKCTMCHENYKAAEPGRAIGALSYTIRIE